MALARLAQTFFLELPERAKANIQFPVSYKTLSTLIKKVADYEKGEGAARNSKPAPSPKRKRVSRLRSCTCFKLIMLTEYPSSS
jgi:hypothetical protein